MGENPASCLICKMDAMTGAAVFKSFRRETNVSSKTGKINSATITEIKNLTKQLFHTRFLDVRPFYSELGATRLFGL